MQVPFARTQIDRLEDLCDAVDNAGLSAFQLSRQPPIGSLVHAAHDGITLSSGQHEGRIQLRGPLSDEEISVCVGLRMPRSRLLLRDIDSGIVCMLRPGEEQEAFHDLDTRYAVLTLSEETLEREAERLGLPFSRNAFRRTRVHPQSMAPAHLTMISDILARLHQADSQSRLSSATFADIVAALIGHFAQRPESLILRPLRQRERIVESTRAHIDQNLGQRLDIEDLARRAGVSRRTLTRSFEETLGESPWSYIARMRLHRIRADLLAADPRTSTIADVANQWGISELGRMSARYRTLFGELPSQTRARGA
ncbi:MULTISPECIES: helix-turn-helix transcriptional regulator [unclassified Mycolicibacterium]|uniref:helix-turn-helix transcriptional regulator n=1 Tax=unclassified Mycolicibacterium TaxID=2636767 RepID=UPI001F4C2E1B|nr:helix-turn-helix transcriptional regulator [Mycolicibacterium sp. YH-1]UNB51132.1 helix-turn-helix transcriptional regulator [Mycolicibacterium sp. YH-1]